VTTREQQLTLAAEAATRASALAEETDKAAHHADMQAKVPNLAAASTAWANAAQAHAALAALLPETETARG
jgi:hypothetical protein